MLVLELGRPRSIPVGSLGEAWFPAGWYLYVGTAFGPGGLVARLCRHIRRTKAHRWHIDRLSSVANLDSIWVLPAQKAECRWADELLKTCRPCRRFMHGFGSSDCRCPGHLLYTPVRPRRAHFPNLSHQEVEGCLKAPYR